MHTIIVRYTILIVENSFSGQYGVSVTYNFRPVYHLNKSGHNGWHDCRAICLSEYFIIFWTFIHVPI